MAPPVAKPPAATCASTNKSHQTTWVDDLRLVPLSEIDQQQQQQQADAAAPAAPAGAAATTHYASSQHQQRPAQDDEVEFTILSFNILAESYLTRRSHPGLPARHVEVVFDSEKRRRLLLETLGRFCGAAGQDAATERFDILCLQELDLPELVLPQMAKWGYGAVHALKGYQPPPAATTTDASTLSGENSRDVPSKRETNSSKSNKRGISEKADTCAILYCRSTFHLVHSQVIEFDDLAGGPALSKSEQPRTKSGISRARKGRGGTPTTALSGMVASYRRRNRAVVAVLEFRDGGGKRRICVSNAHLYWHPGYEYVKLSQAKYLTDRVDEMAREYATMDGEGRVPVVICGDLNSKPESVVHKFMVEGKVDARAVAPWHFHHYDGLNDDQLGLAEADPHTEDDAVVPPQGNDDGDGNDEVITNGVDDLKLACEGRKVGGADADDYTAMALTPGNGLKKIKAPAYGSKLIRDTTPPNAGDEPTVRYLLDFTLNRFTRWLRILGIDAALETEEEERARTRDKNPIIFQRCRSERRTLLTTSKNLLLRKDCPPGTYLVDPKNVQELEKAMVQLFLTHGVVLRPRDFVTRCVVCNGNIFTVANDEDKAKIFKANGCPDLQTDLSVYACNGCGQGYWWCDDLPTSSASRVKNQAAHLLRLCLRGGVQIEGDLHMFDYIDLDEERKIGEDEGTLAGKGREEGPMEHVICWLKEKNLSHPFDLRSAYALLDKNSKDDEERVLGEKLSFTNVTSDFVGTLDYIFYEPKSCKQTRSLKVPTSFRDLNCSGESGGHLLPSDTWPSDHLALGCSLRLTSNPKESVEIPEEKKTMASSAMPLAGQAWAMPAAHAPLCACGCVPKIPSLFEMAEMRKQARLKAEQAKKS